MPRLAGGLYLLCLLLLWGLCGFMGCEPRPTEPAIEAAGVEPVVEERAAAAEPQPTDAAEPRIEPRPPADVRSTDEPATEARPEPVIEPPADRSPTDRSPDKPAPTPCKSACDCPQTQACLKGLCAITRTPVYCCAKKDCPKGHSCLDSSGKQALCQGGPCAANGECGAPTCQSRASDCIQSLPLCAQGKCEANVFTIPHAACDASRGLCLPKACTSAASCGKFGCFDLPGDRCVQYEPICQTGACVSTQQEAGYHECNRITGRCQPKSCTLASDCGAKTCQPNSAFCIQNSPICNGGQCDSSSSNPLFNHTCDSKTGLCQATATCSADADCGTSSCLQKGDTCEVIVPSCDRGQCSLRPFALDASTCSAGKCQPQTCAKDSDCGKERCFDSSSQGGCVQERPTCAGGVCTLVQSLQRAQLCDPQTGRCAAAKTCSKDSDCPKATCSAAQPQGCALHTPRCQQGVCRFDTTTDANRRCDASQGRCVALSCSKSADCGATACRQQTDDCVQWTPHCKGSSCQNTTHTLLGYNCSATGTCQRSCQDEKACGGRQCREIGVDCVQFVPSCVKGQCYSTPRRIANADCVEGLGVCLPRNTCKADADCGKASCTNGGTGICNQLSWTCKAGICDRSTTRKLGSTCLVASGQCTPPQRCQKDADCKQKKCLQSGGNCYQTEEICQAGICVVQTRFLRNSLCGNVTGLCEPTKCTMDSECGARSCRNQGTSCVETTPVCDTRSNNCHTQTRTQTSATCDATTRQCKLTKVCQSNTDCGSPTCSASGGTCSQVTPTCSQSLCSISTQRGPGSCNSSSGTCTYANQSFP